MNSKPTSYLKINGITIKMTWERERSIEKYRPITQVYGIVFNNKGEILICRETPDDKWQIPGGKPEEGESIEEALNRELEEEVGVKASKVLPLGVSQVEYPNNPNHQEGELFYQARYVVILDELLPQSPDPATGHVWERRFVPANQITYFVDWGELGTAMFRDARDLFESIQ